MWLRRCACLALLSGTSCSDATVIPLPTASASSVTAPSAAPPAVAVVVPPSASWPRAPFEPMSIAFRSPPSLGLGEPTMTQDAAALWNAEVWSMSSETKGGVDVHLSEHPPGGKSDTQKFLREFRAAAVPGELTLDAPDAVIKRSRVLGRKDGDKPVLSDTHHDVGVCKRLGDTDYCVHVAGAVHLALGKPGLSRDESLELVAMVRSLERAKGARGPAPTASASAGLAPAK